MRGPYIHPLAVELDAFSAICYATIRIKFSFMQFIIFFLGGGVRVGFFVCRVFKNHVPPLLRGHTKHHFLNTFIQKLVRYHDICLL
jgi:hypothetical protein